MSANADFITLDTYVQQGKNKLTTSFPYMSQNVIFFTFLAIWGGGGGGNGQIWPVLLFYYPLTHIYTHVK